MPRIMIIHAPFGSGHKRAALALEQAFRRRQPGQVEVVDILDCTTPLVRDAYLQSYMQMTDKVPALWGYVYEQTDREVVRYTNSLRAVANDVGLWGLRRVIDKFEPKVIVCTHFMPVEILSARKRRAHFHVPLYCVLTDYAAHQFWAYRNVDGYFVATDDTRRQLVARGVAAELIRVTGIPVDPDISQPKEMAVVREARGLPPPTAQPVITLFGGGLDAATVRVIVEGLQAIELQATLVIVAGRTPHLLDEIGDLASNAHLRLHKLGFINYVDDLIVASDIVITKAGGLTVSEVLARATPMVIIDPIPGQEESNLDYLVGMGAALGIRLPQHLPFAVQTLLNDTARLAQMRIAAEHAARPRAALDIAEAVLRDLGELRV